MNLNPRISQWVLKMGYIDDLPECFGNLYNNSTSFIWNDIVENVKPQQEVENVRNNLIIHRLQSKSLEKQYEYSFSIQEIDVYKRKKDLEEKIRDLKMKLEDKKYNLETMSQGNKWKYIMKEHLKEKNKKEKIKVHILKRRSEMLTQNIQEAEDNLSLVKRLTPIELEDNPNTKTITETLEKCAKKLEILLKDLPSENKKILSSTQKNPKTPLHHSSFENYLSLSERKGGSCSKILHKSYGNKENKNKVSKSLFGLSKIPENTPKKPRESLGILSDSLIEENELCSSESTIDMYNFTSIQYSSSNLLSSGQNFKKVFNPQDFYKNKETKHELSELLHKYHMQTIIGIIKNELESLDIEITTKSLFNITSNTNENLAYKFSEDDFTNLYLIHVQKSLQIVGQNRIIEDFKNKINKRKNYIKDNVLSRIQSKERWSEIERNLDYFLTDFGLNALLTAMKKEIHLSNKIGDDSNELDRIENKIVQMKEDIIGNQNDILQIRDMVKQAYSSVLFIRKHSIERLGRLMQFVMDMSWAQILTDNAAYDELNMFLKYPLKTCENSYFICSNTEMDREEISMICHIVESPFKTPEAILLNILKLKRNLEMYKNVEKCDFNMNYKKYKKESLKKQEAYIEYALDKLCSAMYSSFTNKTEKELKNIVNIWFEMPFKDYISNKRLVKGNEYSFYEKQFDNFYENL